MTLLHQAAQKAVEALTLTEEEREHIHQAIDKLGDYEYLRPELRTETSRTRGVLQKLFRFLPQRMAALQQQEVPREPVALVPVEPTHEMVKVGTEARWRSAIRDANSVLEIYAAMLAAAPTTPESAEKDDAGGVAIPTAYEVVYFRRRPDESEDWLRVPVGTAKQHVREELITRIVPANGVKEAPNA